MLFQMFEFEKFYHILIICTAKRIGLSTLADVGKFLIEYVIELFLLSCTHGGYFPLLFKWHLISDVGDTKVICHSKVESD